MDFEELLSLEGVVKFYREIARGKHPVKEREEWLEWFKGNVSRLEKVLTTLARILYKNNKEILYPLEFIVVPRYPFSKATMYSWSKLQGKTYKDYEVNRLKYYCSRLGKLVNVGVLMKNLVLIDIDGKPEELRKYADVETRRGFHIIRYVGPYEALRVNKTTKFVFHSKEVNIEVMSGHFYLWSYPLQSRWLEYENGKVNVYSYKVLSRDLNMALSSGDVDPIKTTPDEFKELLTDILSEIGLGGYAKNLEVSGVEKLETEVSGSVNVNPKLSKFNVNPLGALGMFGYEEFKNALSKCLNVLPYCFKMALYGSPVKGSRYFHLRLLLAVLPYFVLLNEDNIRKLVEDFSIRTYSKPSEIREWMYHAKYFTGKIGFGDEQLHVPSKFGVPTEAWSFFETAGYCSQCPLGPSCTKLDYSKRRRHIVEYLDLIITEYVEASP